MGGGSLAGTRSKEACRLPSFSGVEVACNGARRPLTPPPSMVLMLIVVSRCLLHLLTSGRRTRGPFRSSTRGRR